MTSAPDALSFVPQIQALHDKALSAQRTSFKTSLAAAIEAGELALKAKEVVGHGNGVNSVKPICPVSRRV